MSSAFVKSHASSAAWSGSSQTVEPESAAYSKRMCAQVWAKMYCGTGGFGVGQKMPSHAASCPWW